MSLSEHLKYADAGNGETHLTATEGLFAGTTWKYGKVWFKDPDEPELSFDYDLIATPLNFDKVAFEQYAGEIIVEILKAQVAQSAVVYSGGTNEGIVDET